MSHNRAGHGTPAPYAGPTWRGALKTKRNAEREESGPRCRTSLTPVKVFGSHNKLPGLGSAFCLQSRFSPQQQDQSLHDNPTLGSARQWLVVHELRGL